MASGSYKKVNVMLPRVKAVRAPANLGAPPKVKLYSKNQPGDASGTGFFGGGFGTTGLQQTPSIIGIGKNKNGL